LSVNVSPRQFHDPGFVSDVLTALDVSGVAPERLTLEITENLLIRDTLEITRIMGHLADRGVRFSVDDFGTGYSSLHYLRHLPIHELKIDRSFIAQVPWDVSSVAIVEAILAMAHRLDLDVVAEGVETAEHVAFLGARGRMRMQGFFFAEPLNATAWLNRRFNPVVSDDLQRSAPVCK
jgi:EAL domain-containing protein (putative c-di-GMP-specific phosphodiesterase class I)